MQKISKIVFAIVLSVFLFSGYVFAADSGATQTQDATQATTQVGILPSNPLYFFKDLGREIQVFFTFNPIRKAELRLEFSNEKLAEAQKLVENNPNATDTISKALDSYKKETDNLTVDTKNLKQDSPTTQNLLRKISEQVFNSQKILENLASRNIVQQKVQEVKEGSLNNIATSLFKIASPEKAKDALESATTSPTTGTVDPTAKVDVIQKIQERAPEEAKKAIIEATKNVIDTNVNSQNLTEDQKNKLKQIAESLKSTVEYKQIVIEDYANQIINNNPELFSNLNNISDADKAILKNYAQNLLQGGLNNIDPQKVLNDLNSLNISSDSKKIIDDIQGDVVNKITNGQISCINIVNPICGKDGKTYNNVCELKKVGVEINYVGKCGECIAEGKASSVTGKCCPGLIFCPANATSATAANINGLCKKTCDKTSTDTTEGGVCMQTWDPICGANGKTYSNECFLKKAGVNMQYKGECKTTNTTTNPSSTVANPASVYCKEQGYTTEIRTNNDGSQYGMCIFATGKECEEWAFYRNQCGDAYKRVLTAGKVEEAMCNGKEYSISWESKNISKVKISLIPVLAATATTTTASTTYSLGEYDASQSSFTWVAGKYNTQTIAPGKYQVKIISIPSGSEKEVVATSNVFTLSECKTETTTTY